MGFSELSVSGSDNASDSASMIQRVIVKQLKKEFKLVDNNYNTPGWLNVSMIIIEMFKPANYWFYEPGFQTLIEKCLKKLEQNPHCGESTKGIYKKLLKFYEDCK